MSQLQKSRAVQRMPAGDCQRRVCAVPQDGRWIVSTGSLACQTMTPVQFDSRAFGTTPEECIRLCDALAARWPECFIEVWPADEDDEF